MSVGNFFTKSSDFNHSQHWTLDGGKSGGTSLSINWRHITDLVSAKGKTKEMYCCDSCFDRSILMFLMRKGLQCRIVWWGCETISGHMQMSMRNGVTPKLKLTLTLILTLTDTEGAVLTIMLWWAAMIQKFIHYINTWQQHHNCRIVCKLSLRILICILPTISISWLLLSPLPKLGKLSDVTSVDAENSHFGDGIQQ